MKNKMIILVGILFISLGCQNDAAVADVNIRVKNVDSVVIDTFFIGYGTLIFEDVKPGEITAYQSWPNDYRPGIFELRTAQETYGPIIYDYLPEAYNIQKGLYTIELHRSYNFQLVKD